MLLLFLFIFFQYDLLHCGEEQENVNNMLLDYSITERLQSSTPSTKQIDRITPQHTFKPTLHGHMKFVPFGPNDVPKNSPPHPIIPAEEQKTFTPFPNMTRPSYPFPIEKHTIMGPTRRPLPPPLSSTWHINYPGLTPPANFPSGYRYPSAFTTADDSYSPSPTGPTPKRPSFTWPVVSRPQSTAYWGPASTTAPPETSPVSWNPAEAYVKHWKEQIASDVAAGMTPIDMVPKLRQIFNYDYTTSAEEFPMAVRRIPKISQREFDSKQLKDSQEVTVRAKSGPGEPRSGHKVLSYTPDHRAEEAVKQKQIQYRHTLTAATITQKADLLNVSMGTIAEDEKEP